jgi:DNA-binding GntR family transcriptional regulator
MITRKPGGPAWRQLEQVLLERVTGGAYGPGALIPSESEMVLEFGVSRSTIRKALAALRYDGWVVPVAGRGTYVADPLPERG